MTSRFRCRGIVHECSVVQTSEGDLVEFLNMSPDGSRAWLGLVDDVNRPVEYDGPVVRLVCEKRFGGFSPVLLRRPDIEASETVDDVDCMACLAAGVVS